MINITRKSISFINKYQINHEELNSRRYENQIIFKSFKGNNIIEFAKIEAWNLSIFDISKIRIKWLDWFQT